VLPQIHHSMRISATLSCWTCRLLVGKHSAPYNMAHVGRKKGAKAGKKGESMRAIEERENEHALGRPCSRASPPPCSRAGSAPALVLALHHLLLCSRCPCSPMGKGGPGPYSPTGREEARLCLLCSSFLGMLL
jgi:hypothetical protein